MAINRSVWGDDTTQYGLTVTTNAVQDVFVKGETSDAEYTYMAYRATKTPIVITPIVDFDNNNAVFGGVTGTPIVNGIVYTTWRPFTSFTSSISQKTTAPYYSTITSAWSPYNGLDSANSIRIVTKIDTLKYMYCIVVSIYNTTSGIPSQLVVPWDTYITQYSNYKICGIFLQQFAAYNSGESRTYDLSYNKITFPQVCWQYMLDCPYDVNDRIQYSYPHSDFSYTSVGQGYSEKLFDGYNIPIHWLETIDGTRKLYGSETSRMLYFPDIGDITYDYRDVNHGMFYLKNVTLDKILSVACQYGFFVTTNRETAKNGAYDSDNVYGGIFGSDGTYSGNYTHGVDNNNNTLKNGYDNANINIDWTDPNKYTDKIDLNTPAISTNNLFNRTFALNSNNVYDLSKFLWNADATVFDEIIKGLGLMGGNPIAGIIDLRLYPFDVSSKSTTTPASIVIGRTDTKINALTIKNYNAVIDCGQCTFHKKFNNFLDYEPYTTASLYVPYVGVIPISTAQFAGKTITVKMIADITTGSCTSVVFCNDIPIIYKNGTIGVDIPVSATDSAQYASRILSGVTSAGSDFAVGAATGDIGQIISGVGSIVNAGMQTNNTIYSTSGASSPSCANWQPQNCYFIIQRPVPIVPDNYGHTVGYACNYQSAIGECSGYTQTYNVDVSTINAPESEKNAIAEILNSGFYA